jgi:hypothetical protein
MKVPRFHRKFLAFTASMALAALTPFAHSQPPSVPAEVPADSKKPAAMGRIKPQVIYHLSKTSSDAAAFARAGQSRKQHPPNRPQHAHVASVFPLQCERRGCAGNVPNAELSKPIKECRRSETTFRQK